MIKWGIKSGIGPLLVLEPPLPPGMIFAWTMQSPISALLTQACFMCKEKYSVIILGLPAEENMRENGKNNGWMKSKWEKSSMDYPSLQNHKPPYQMA